MGVFDRLTKLPDLQLPINYETASPQLRRKAREEYIMEQKGACYLCGELLSDDPARHILDMEIDEELFPDGFFDNPIHLHHDHVTGTSIGTVHCRCNAYMWQYEGS